MKTAIVCKSVSHGNTRRVAETIGGVLDARVVDPAEIDPAELTGYDLVGFGSGIYWMSFHAELRRLVRELPGGQRGAAFVFATSGMPETPLRPYLRELADTLGGKGFRVAGTFTCRGLDTVFPLGLIGGLNKGRPGTDDLAAAHAFAQGLRTGGDAG
ncbi:flavodoxin family protein [Nocardia thailandica]|uniref:Flavodoxin family protein n=1 Tax=Nocardia thailandica TaxID=257275 RepID=A0ABW6PSI4_9NOCA